MLWTAIDVEGCPRQVKLESDDADLALSSVGGTRGADLKDASGDQSRDALGDWHPDGVVLALHSRVCLTGRVPTDGLLRRGRRTALLYRLEDQWPLDAETLTADWAEHDGEVFAVAAETQRLRPWLDCLEEHGVPVQAIIPLSFLPPPPIAPGQSQAAAEEPDAPNRPDETHIVARWPGGCDRVVYRDGRVADWSFFPEGFDPLESSGPAERSFSASQRVGDFESPWLAAARGAEQVLGGQRSAPLNLRRDALAPRSHWLRYARPLTAWCIAAAASLLSVAGVLLLDAWHAREATHTATSQQAARFREAFPGRAVPAAPLSRLRSEASLARGRAGERGLAQTQHDTLAQLQALLVALPTPEGRTATAGAINPLPSSDSSVTSTALQRGMRYRILELRLDPRRLYLDGQARSHGDAERIAAALRRLPAFVLDSPRTQNLRERGVSFTLHGQRAESSIGEVNP
ncbi:MAG: type II secretion system protein GspL [Planctomycetota bacterium]